MNTAFGFSLVGAGRAGHDPQLLAWSLPLIAPAGQCTANPIMPPLPRRRDDRQPTRACPQPGPPAMTRAPHTHSDF